ncbi:unnamed protein product [Orchesella dallaii]|uniref:Protein msta n=1 Tax=Orchesella dallaii TaxID=48710 RepID=A0ABP1RZF2_9HEXA
MRLKGPGISGRGGYEPLCLGCTEPVSSEQKCSSCQWPLCGRQCENNLHSKYECDIFTKNLVKELKDPFQYELLRILRCLLTRERDPPMFEELMKLETASEHRILLESQSKAVETALIFINQNCKLLEYDIELIDRMCGVVELHSQVTGMYRTTMGIYSFTSKLMYACAANTRLVEVKGSNKFDSKFRIIVVKPINKGEHLTFNLMETLVPGYIRTRFLKEYYYECDCELCADPTEKGTYFSAIKCASCNQFSKEPGDKPKVIENGYLISDTVQDLSSNWKCMNCDNFADGESILRLLDQIDDEYQLFRRQLPSKSLDENLCQLTSKIRMYHDNFHPNHFFNWRLNYLYMTLLVDYVHSLKYPDTWESLRHVFDQIEEIIHPLISTLLTLKPGATLAKGKILYDAVRALWCFIQWAVIFGNAQSFDKHQDAKYFYALAAETIGILQFEITATDQKLISQIYYMKNNKTNIFERLKHHSVIAERKEIPST